MSILSRQPALARFLAIARSATGHAAPIPAPFLGRVRRRRVTRLAPRAAAVAMFLSVGAVTMWVMRTQSPARSEWTYVEVKWPPLPPGGTGGPVKPLRAGIRPDSAEALSLLQ